MYSKTGKGSLDIVKRGSAFRSSGPEKVELFPESHEVAAPMELSDREQEWVNSQRLLVNHMLSTTCNTRVHLGSSELHSAALSGEPRPEMWKRFAAEIGACYYPSELMTDSRSVLFGVQKKSASSSAKMAKSLEALESSEQKAPEEGGGDQSPKSGGEEDVESSDESIGGEDYNVRMDFEDEGARDDYDDGDGGGDYGGEGGEF